MDIGVAGGVKEEEEDEEEKVQMLYFKQISIIKIKAPCTQNRLAIMTKKKRFTHKTSAFYFMYILYTRQSNYQRTW